MRMSRWSVMAIFFLLSLFGLGLRSAPPDLSSPKATLQSFIKAVSDKDTGAMAACVKEGDATALAKLDDLANVPLVEINDLVAEIEGDTAKVAVEYKLPNQATPSNLSRVDIFNLKKDGEKWLIVSPLTGTDPTAVEDQWKRVQTHMLLTLVIFAAPNESATKVLEESRRKAQATASLSNIKQLGLGMLMYVQDYDETYVYPSNKWKQLILPYIKNEKIFRAPVAPPDETISYSMNPHLEGITLAVIEAPANTILLYEGKDQKPLYRYEGRAVIGFADGHARLLTETQVAQYVWNDKNWVRQKPVVPKPAPKTRTRKKP